MTVTGNEKVSVLITGLTDDMNIHPNASVHPASAVHEFDWRRLNSILVKVLSNIVNIKYYLVAE